MGKIEYIGNKLENGIKYDLQKIIKEYKKLKCPPTVYNPCKLPLGRARWFALLSERSTGKTTNIILLGMLFNKHYGTQIQYIRQKETMIMPKNIQNIFATIIECHYVEKITDGKYNSIIYKSRRWYYCKVDEDGKILEQDNNYFMINLSIDNNEVYKSSYNAPFGDFIIFDEFIGKFYYPNEFVTLCDLIKTIIRSRQSLIGVFMLANTINRHSEYFNELSIYDEVQALKVGDSGIYRTPHNTQVYVELIGIKSEERTTTQQLLNELYFGFNNPLLSSITGGDWAIKNYPHAPKYEKQTICRNYYISHNNKLVNIEICHTIEIGYIAILHWAYRTYDDSIIYCIEDISDKNHRYKFGSNKSDTFIWNFHKLNKFYYATNDIGDFVANYIASASKL